MLHSLDFRYPVPFPAEQVTTQRSLEDQAIARTRAIGRAVLEGIRQQALAQAAPVGDRGQASFSRFLLDNGVETIINMPLECSLKQCLTGPLLFGENLNRMIHGPCPDTQYSLMLFSSSSTPHPKVTELPKINILLS